MKSSSYSPFISKNNDMGVVSINGEKVSEFLQGQFTSNIASMQNNSVQFSAYLERKGRVVATFWCIKQSEQKFLLLLPKCNIANLLTPLKKFAMFSKVLCEDITKDYNVISTFGLAHALLAEVLQIAVCEKNELLETEDLMYLNINTNPDASLLIIKKSSTENIYLKILNLDVNEKSAPLQEVLLGLPFLTAANSSKHLAHSLNLPALNAVSFTKGCFLGQEIVARVENLGNPKKALYQLVYKKDPQKPYAPGAEIFNKEQKQIGEVILSAENNDEILVLGSTAKE